MTSAMFKLYLKQGVASVILVTSGRHLTPGAADKLERRMSEHLIRLSPLTRQMHPNYRELSNTDVEI